MNNQQDIEICKNNLQQSPMDATETRKDQINSIAANFVENTTFPGIALINKTTNPIRRYLWILFLILGTTMAIYQSLDLIQGYREYQVFTTTAEKNNETVDFPSVTFCPHLPVLWKTIRLSNHSVYQKFEKNFTEWLKLEPLQRYHVRVDLKAELMNFINSLPEEERNQVLPRRRDIIISIIDSKWEEVGDEFFTSTYIPAYGQCFTFNPGLPGFPKKRVNPSEKFYLPMYLDPEERPPFLLDEGIIINLHPMGTAPEIHSGKVVTVQSGQQLFASIGVEEINRLEAPFPSQCIRQKENEHLDASVYFSKTKPYLYSRRACKEKYAHSMILEKLKCLDPHLPVPEKEKGKELCDDMKINQVDGGKSGCLLNCYEMSYDWAPVATNLRFTDELWEEYTSVINLTRPITVAEMKKGFLLVILKIRSAVYEIHREQPKYTMSDILGAIGGNIGLWVGISIISFMEVFEFIVRISVKFFQRTFLTRNPKQKMKCSASI